MVASFQPVQAVLGGLFIGVASGVYMYLCRRVAGNSCALRTVILLQFDIGSACYLAGLFLGGALVKVTWPDDFETPPPASLRLFVGCVVTGTGVTYAQGCTSGHGLSGISQFSKRSLVAVPVFMLSAICSATAMSGSLTLGSPVPVRVTPPETLELAAKIACALAVAIAPAVVLSKCSPIASNRDFELTSPEEVEEAGNAKDLKEVGKEPERGDFFGKEPYVGLWVGTCFGIGLGVGGMARPSSVIGALSPVHPDPTLWVLFVTALSLTFIIYRIAEKSGIKEAVVEGGTLDSHLVIGSILFGIGWGVTGLCPGPHIVGLGAMPLSPGLWVAFVGTSVGICCGHLLIHNF